MGRKQVLDQKKVINAEAMTADITSEVIHAEYLDMLDFVVAWSSGSSPVGVFKVQGANELEAKDRVWRDISGDGNPSASGVSGEHILHIHEIQFKWYRVFYDFTSGSGTLNAWAKGTTRGA